VGCFGKIHGMTSSLNLDHMTPEQLRALAAQLLSKVDTMGRKIHRDETSSSSSLTKSRSSNATSLPSAASK
jgi:hypothetical protein